MISKYVESYVEQKTSAQNEKWRSWCSGVVASLRIGEGMKASWWRACVALYQRTAHRAMRCAKRCVSGALCVSRMAKGTTRGRRLRGDRTRRQNRAFYNNGRFLPSISWKKQRKRRREMALVATSVSRAYRIRRRQRIAASAAPWRHRILDVFSFAIVAAP